MAALLCSELGAISPLPAFASRNLASAAAPLLSQLSAHPGWGDALQCPSPHRAARPRP